MKPEKKKKEIKIEESDFKKDYSKENPGLHLLYVKWAVVHLNEINKMIKKLDDFYNLNMSDFILAMVSEKEKIIKENKAYFDANEIIESIGLGLNNRDE